MDEVTNLLIQLRALVDGERPASPWMTAGEVADYLRLSSKSVQNMTGPSAKNPIPFHRLSAGGEKRFHREEVDGWLRSKSSTVTLGTTNGEAPRERPSPGHKE